MSDTTQRWNRAHPIGTRVRYWPGYREGEGRMGVTRSEAFVVGAGEGEAVFVDGFSVWIALTHVEPIGAGDE